MTATPLKAVAFLTATAALAALIVPLEAQSETKPETPVVGADASPKVQYNTTEIDGLDIFYREAGPVDAPILVLLHGFHQLPTFNNRVRQRFLQIDSLASLGSCDRHECVPVIGCRYCYAVDIVTRE